MASESLLVSEVVPAAPREIFSAWLDTNTHSAFTGETANIEPFVGGSHSAFNGYATGRFVRLEKDHVIAATWRSSEFPDDAADSHIEVTLEETVGGTTLTLLHTDIPDGLAEQCRDAWIKYYLVPLRQHFAARADADNVDDEVRVVVTTEDPEEATDDLDDAVSETGNGGPSSDGRGSSRGRNGVASRAEVAAQAEEMDGEEDEDEDEDDVPSTRESERRSPRAAGMKTESTRGGTSDRSSAGVKAVRPATAAKGKSKTETSTRAKVAPPMQSASSGKAATTNDDLAAKEMARTGKATSAAKMPSKAAPATKAASASKSAPATKAASATKAAAATKAKGAAPASRGVKTKSVAGGRPKAKAVASRAKSRTAGAGKKPGRPAANAALGARAARPAKTTKAKAGKSRSAMTAARKAARKPTARTAAKKTSAAAKASIKAKSSVDRTPAKKTAKRGSRPRR